MRSWGAAGIWGSGGVTPRGETWAPGTALSIPHPSLPLRRIEELTRELAASNRLVETLSAEKRDLQQRLEEPPAVEAQVGGQAPGDPSLAPRGRAWGAGRTRRAMSGERPPACAVLLQASALPAPVCCVNLGS